MSQPQPDRVVQRLLLRLHRLGQYLLWIVVVTSFFGFLIALAVGASR